MADESAVIVLTDSDSQVEKNSPPSHSKYAEGPTSSSNLCSRHSTQLPQGFRLSKSNVKSESVIVISSSQSNSDIEIVDIKGPAHICQSRVQEVQTPSASEVPIQPKSNSGTCVPAANSPTTQHRPPLYTCSKHQGIHVQPCSPYKTAPVAAVRPQPRLEPADQNVAPTGSFCSKHSPGNKSSTSSQLQLQLQVQSPPSQALVKTKPHTPSPCGGQRSNSQSPTKKLLSAKRRNELSSLAQKQLKQSSSSTDSDDDEVKPPVIRVRRKKHSKAHKENLHAVSRQRQQQGQFTQLAASNSMYLEKDLIAQTRNNSPVNMPVSSSPSDILPLGDLPCYPMEEDPSVKRSKKNESYEKIEGSRRKRRHESVYMSPVSDSDSDEELSEMWGESALQENAIMRKERHQRNASPYRNPLQVTQDQAILRKTHGFQTVRRQELVYSPTKRSKLSNSKTLKQCDPEPPVLPLSSIDRIRSPHRIEEPPVLVPSADSSDLEAIHWSPNFKKVIKEEEPRHNSKSSALVSNILSCEHTRKLANTPSIVVHKQKTPPQPPATSRTPSSIGFDIHVSASQRKDVTSAPMCQDSKEHVVQKTIPSSSVPPERASPAASAPLSAPRSELHKKLYLAGVPTHMKPKCSAVQSSDEETSQQGSNEKLCFGMYIQTLLEGCQEEGHHNDTIDFIHSFTNVRRCPSNRHLNYILEDILMTKVKVDSAAWLMNAFQTLKHIQYLHPRSKFVQWKTINSIMQVLLCDGANTESNQESDLLKLHGNMLALKYITSVLEEDLQMQNENVNRSYVYNMLSSDSCIANVKSIMSWISQCVQRIHDEELERTNSTQSVQPQPVSRLSVLYPVLELLQKLLHMCLVASANLDQGAAKVADELLYFYRRLPSYEHKRKVLQTITCHQMRMKLIELVLQDYEIDDDDARDQRALTLSISKVVEFYFKCIPSRDDDDDDDGDEIDDDDDVVEDTKTSTKDPTRDCEELTMLLLFLMQSYIWSSNGKLPDTDRTLRMRSPNENHHHHQQRAPGHPANQLLPFHGKFTLSMSDRECLIMMGDFVEDLRRRLLRSSLNLTVRTKLYLSQMEAMRDLADCD